MRKIPFDIGTIHFTGIGGIGMSGIAEVMHNLGYSVQGSDLSENANVVRLRGLGIDVKIGQVAENVTGTSAVVVSTAVPATNEEVVAARAQQIPVVRRADMLAELMRLKWCISIAGTHGKTTTTSMVAALLDAADFDPTVINGGIVNAYGSNARLGAGDWMVVEADESDGSFNKLPATIAVVTNMDPEHLDFYGDFAGVRAAFRAFVEKIPFYGAAVLCIDHPEVQSMIPHIMDKKIITYGISTQADVQLSNIRFVGGGAEFDVKLSDNFADAVGISSRVITGFKLPMPGRHNVTNAGAAIAVSMEMGIDVNDIKRGFAGFSGVKRRFTIVGTVNGITIVDDYGHHPVEIAAVLSAAREAYDGKVIAVVQPHRYTRLHDLFDEFCTAFNDADQVIVAPVYEAGEAPIEGADHHSLARGLKSRGHRHVHTIDDQNQLAGVVAGLAGQGDLVVCLGGGSITNRAAALPAELAQLLNSSSSINKNGTKTKDGGKRNEIGS